MMSQPSSLTDEKGMLNPSGYKTSDSLMGPQTSPDPPVSYLETIWFICWVVKVIIIQAWQDLTEWNWYTPRLSSDRLTHYFFIPVGRRDPRLVISGPYPRMMVRIVPENSTRRYEELDVIDDFPCKEVINCASNNYGGFTLLEQDLSNLLQKGLHQLPFAPSLPLLELEVRTECARYMGFNTCAIAPSGFSTNILAFSTVASVAERQGRTCVFLCDWDCHNSMFTGAYMNKRAITHKFDHNDMTDLKAKLDFVHKKYPNALVCVAIEGLYSMEGSIAPIPSVIALKEIYRFTLLVDEAHSFMALGSTGRGSFDHWQDSGYDCPLSKVEVMTCMFSKSVGCTGGMVLANNDFAEELGRQRESFEQNGVEGLSTIVLLRVLSLLRTPQLIQHRMRLLRTKAVYVANELSKAGCKVISSPGSAVICFPVGTIHQVVILAGEALKRGLAIVGGVPPATTLWGCRIRICIFATTPWPAIYEILYQTISICRKHGIPGVKPVHIDAQLLVMKDSRDLAAEKESRETNQTLDQRIDSLIVANPKPQIRPVGTEDEVLSAGASALQKYGVGPCSARWFYGSFDVFLKLEQRLAQLYTPLLKQAKRCRAMICGDAEVTIGSTVTACVVDHVSPKVLHVVFVAHGASPTVLKGATLARANDKVTIHFYESVHQIWEIISRLDSRRFYMTVYFETVRGNEPLNLLAFFENALANRRLGQLTGMTILLDDRKGMGKIGPRKLGYLDLMESRHGPDFLNEGLQWITVPVAFLVMGSWYDAFGHQGGYVTGTATLVESLTWNAKAYFFSTPPMPLQAAMSDKTLELLEKRYE